MCPKLVTYKHVPLGFETVIENTDVEMGKTWNLWWNVKPTDDPESWDSEIKAINKIQSKLSEPNMNQRLTRAQIAEFCRLHPLFPQSIAILCKEIGESRFSTPVKIGCEGRGLLDSLGYHDHESLREQRKEFLTQHVKSLKKWLRQSQPETSTESKVCGFLGQSTDSKISLVDRLIHIVNPNESSIHSLRRLAEDVCTNICDDFKTLDRPFNCFRCLPEEASIPKCQCCYSMFLDACLLCAGTSGEKKSISDEFRRFVEENVLVYSVAVNSWLEGKSPKHAAWSKNMRYVSKDGVLETIDKAHSCLGERDEVKEWLAACLLKTIKNNQRWHKRTELIDDFPEATSYFKKIL